MTYTYAIMEVSPETYDEIHRKILEAGYDHQIHDFDVQSGRGKIDMHGIALRTATPEQISAAKSLV